MSILSKQRFGLSRQRTPHFKIGGLQCQRSLPLQEAGSKQGRDLWLCNKVLHQAEVMYVGFRLARVEEMSYVVGLVEHICADELLVELSCYCFGPRKRVKLGA